MSEEDVARRYEVIDPEEDEYSLFDDDSQFALAFEASQRPVSLEGFDFEDAFLPAYNKEFPEAAIDNVTDVDDEVWGSSTRTSRALATGSGEPPASSEAIRGSSRRSSGTPSLSSRSTRTTALAGGAGRRGLLHLAGGPGRS